MSLIFLPTLYPSDSGKSCFKIIVHYEETILCQEIIKWDKYITYYNKLLLFITYYYNNIIQ